MPTATEVGDALHPLVRSEISRLIEAGHDVNLVDPPPRVTDQHTKSRVDAAIARLELRDDCVRHLFRDNIHPVGAAWFSLAKRAVALWPLYAAGTISHLGEGIDPAAFDRPHFAGDLSARQVLAREKGPDKAELIVERYLSFLNQELTTADRFDEYGLHSWDYLTHVVDSHAVRTRADAAIERIRTHFFAGSDQPRKQIISASLACGASAPVFELARTLREKHHAHLAMKLVDSDVMALATAQSLAERYGVESDVEIHHRDLMRDTLTSYIAPNSVDVVDMLGLFEYIPARVGIWPLHHRAAADLLASVKAIIRPGGLIVFGNMLRHRPQQEFFDKVWPTLQQRTISEVLAIIRHAGYDLDTVTVDIPRREAVYAIYTIRIPDGSPPRHQRNLRQQAARKLVHLREY